ncbi:MAG TPA: alpha/beta hydrolase [Blastocatellia bacterium]|nr:alpha/beta hydrolase [Blastocatellia bacterium]
MMKLVKTNLVLFLFPVCIFSAALAQNSSQPPAQTPNQPAPIPLWANGAPGAKGDAPDDIPSVQLYQPPADKASGAAIVVCPGGGYAHLAPHEGHDIAVWLNGIGVTAVVLKYRLGPKYQHPAMMQDALRAIRFTRSKAAEWKIDPNRVGVMGFSAGGHLASTAATQFNVGDPNASDPVEKLSSRPDLLVLGYPVITMTDPFAHKGSRQNLLGENPPGQLINLMSNEKQVTDQTPPTFIFHTGDDPVVPVENSLMFALALRKKKVLYELHVYEHGRHGVGLASDDPVLKTWPRLLENWLRARGFVNQSQRISDAPPAKNRNPELVRLIDELRAAPPEFAADSMIKLSPHPEIDDAWRAEILEEAFRIAFDAQHPYKLKHLSESKVETRTGYKGLAFDLKMDRLSLQLLAILNMVRLDQKKARLLWGEMLKPKLEPLKCEEPLLYDVADYYRAMVEMARQAFTREEMRIGEEIQFVDSHIINIASPAEVTEAAVAIMDLKTAPDQFNALVETYSRAFENVASDNRSFWFKPDQLSAAPLALAGECKKRGFPTDFLLTRYRDYVVRQLGAPRCADNLTSDVKRARPPEFVTSLNAALNRYEYIPKITDNDVKPRKIDREALFYPYWTTQRARSLLEKIYVLRFGQAPKQTTRAKSNEPPEPLSFEARQSSEWQYQLSDFLREMAEWKPEHEASKADYFHQKCRLFNELLELSPNSDMRLRMLDEYMAFLEQNRFECESFIDWYQHVSDLLRRIRSMEAEERKLSLEALRYSNDHVLQLCVKLMPAIEAALKASHKTPTP